MNTRSISRIAAALVLLSTLIPQLSTCLAQGTAFTYQGRLNDGANPANGIYDLRFAIYDSASGPGIVAGPLTNSPVAVSNGLFTVTLDPGVGVFTGAGRWLEVALRTNGGSVFTVLTPRQQLTGAPQAVFALNAGTAASAASVAAGAVGATALQASAVTSDKIANGTITVADVNSASFSNTFWKVDGNAGTMPGAHFLGTTDNQALEVKVNNTRALRLENNGSGAPNVIGGASFNYVATNIVGATIAGGGATVYYLSGSYSNSVSSDFGFVGGGMDNHIETDAFASGIVGGTYNTVQDGSTRAVIGGGGENRVGPNSDYSTIVGGHGNFIVRDAGSATIAGGAFGVVNSNSGWSVIGGGFDNVIAANSPYATVAGGAGNNIGADALSSAVGGGEGHVIAAAAWHATIAGGQGNSIGTNSDDSTVGGGNGNAIADRSIHATIAGGTLNRVGANADSSAIGGGYENVVGPDAWYATVAGGKLNTIGANADSSAIGGGYENEVAPDSWYATVGGGRANGIGTNCDYSTIAGGGNNTIETSSEYATVAGGEFNRIGEDCQYGAIGGGEDNVIIGDSAHATIAGGRSNFIWTNSTSSTIGGGFDHWIGDNSANATIAGGHRNSISSDSPDSTIAGGDENLIEANSARSTISGGRQNRISKVSVYSTIGGGSSNYTSGAFATIPGGLDNLASDYAFAAGRHAFALHTGAFVWADSRSSRFNSTADDEVSFRCHGGVRFTDGSGIADHTVSWTPGSGSWSFTSDRRLKDRVTPVDPQSVLEKLSRIPIHEWSYIGYAQRHIGPMAQDFHALFPFNENDKTLNDADLHGVALAAIQGLNEKVESGERKAKAEIESLKAENAELKRELGELKQLVGSLAGKWNGGAK